MRSRRRLRLMRSKRVQKQRRARQLDSIPSQEYIALRSGLTLLDLPQDIFHVIVHMIGVGDQADRNSARDLASIARTCKKLRRDIAPYLYQKIYTRIETTHDTSSIVRLVRQKPGIRRMIRTMVLDDFDHRQTRHLLSHEFPRLQRILIQHVGDVPKSISAREKRYLNRNIRPQPMLKHLVFMVRCPKQLYRLTEEDAVFFIHPTLKYIRLYGLDLCAFEGDRASAMRHEQLSIFSIADTNYTSKAIQQLVMPSTSLTRMTLCETHSLALAHSIYSSLLTHSTVTLTHLKLFWMGGYRNLEDEGKILDFSSFTALQLLAIDPVYVLGRLLPTDGEQEMRDAAQLIARRLPPNVGLLILEGLVSPFPCPIQRADTWMYEVFPNKGEVLIQVLLEQKKALIPKLEHLFVDCGRGDTWIPDWLCEMAEELEVNLGLENGFELCDEEVPSLALLDRS